MFLLIVVVFTFATNTSIIEISLRGLVQALQQALIDDVFALLVIHINLIYVSKIIVLVIGVLALMSVGQLAIVLVTLLELALLLDVDHFRVVYADRSSERLGSDDLVDQIHSLCGKLDPLDGLLLAHVGVDVADRVRVQVVEGTCWHHVEVSTSLVDSLNLI